jgi:hypothetical protein
LGVVYTCFFRFLRGQTASANCKSGRKADGERAREIVNENARAPATKATTRLSLPLLCKGSLGAWKGDVVWHLNFGTSIWIRDPRWGGDIAFETSILERSLLRRQLWDVNFEMSIFGPRFWDVESGTSLLRCQLWDVDFKISTLASPFWDVDFGMSFLGRRLVLFRPSRPGGAMKANGAVQTLKGHLFGHQLLPPFLPTNSQYYYYYYYIFGFYYSKKQNFQHWIIEHERLLLKIILMQKYFSCMKN